MPAAATSIKEHGLWHWRALGCLAKGCTRITLLTQMRSGNGIFFVDRLQVPLLAHRLEGCFSFRHPGTSSGRRLRIRQCLIHGGI